MHKAICGVFRTSRWMALIPLLATAVLAQDTDIALPPEDAAAVKEIEAAAERQLQSDGTPIQIPTEDQVNEARPSDSELPDALTNEPLVPADLISPIPRTPTRNDADTVQSSSRTLDMLRRTAKGSEVATNASPLSLDEAVGHALKNNPDILNAVQSIRLTRGQMISIASQALPQVTASSAYNVQEVGLFSQPTGENANANRSTPQNQSWNVQIGASQLLFDGGATVAGIQAAKFVEDSAYFSLRQTIDRVVAEVKTNFFLIILNRALIVAQEQSVALLESQLQDQINRFEAGTVPRFNVLQAEVALANAIPPLIQARNNLRISQFELVRLMGMNYPAGQLSEVPFNVVGDLAYTIRQINTELSIRMALERSPLLKAQRQQILSQAANINVALAGYLPRISAQGGYQWQNNNLSQQLTDTVEGWFFGVTGSWDIFDGFETAGNVMQAKAQLSQAKINYDNSVRQVILDVQVAVSDLQEARETLDSQQASVEQATEALRLSRERLDAGAGTQLDVLNAQVQLLQAQTTLLQAKFDYIAALARYDAALSLDTQYVETFADPFTQRQRRIFFDITQPDKPQPKLPRVYRNDDPLARALGEPVDGEQPKPTPGKN